jgi:hypothetical protein
MAAVMVGEFIAQYSTLPGVELDWGAMTDPNTVGTRSPTLGRIRGQTDMSRYARRTGLVEIDPEADLGCVLKLPGKGLMRASDPQVRILALQPRARIDLLI